MKNLTSLPTLASRNQYVRALLKLSEKAQRERELIEAARKTEQEATRLRNKEIRQRAQA